MTFPEINADLSGLVRGVVGSVRKAVLSDGPRADSLDRSLVALTLIAGAVAIVWPEGRKVPSVIATGARLGRHLWARRSWWVEETPAPPRAIEAAPAAIDPPDGSVGA